MNKQKKSKKGIFLIVLVITIIVMVILTVAIKYNQYSKIWLLTTGAVDNFKVNNVYDMTGNVIKWTMEGHYTSSRALRGGSFISASSSATISGADSITISTYSYGANLSLT